MLGALFFAQTGQGHPLQSVTALRVYALVFYAVYFVWFWAARGQTLAMQTWRIAVVRADGATLGQARALLRFIACCIGWFGVPLAIAALAGAGARATLGGVALWIPLWALASRLEPSHQFWHDRASGTRLVDLRA